MRSKNKTKAVANYRVVMEAFSSRLAGVVKETAVTVFVSGPKFSKTPKPGRQKAGAAIRRFVTQQINNIDFAAVLGEHKRLRKAPPEAVEKFFSDADKELLFAKSDAELIVIFPASWGSIAELGIFGMHQEVAQKLIVIFDAALKRSGGFVIRALLKSIRNRNARAIRFIDYRNKQKVWEAVEKELRSYQTTKVQSVYRNG